MVGDDESSPLGPDIPRGAEAPRELRRAFWRLVFLFKLVLFPIAVGALIAVVLDDPRLGGSLIAIGVVAGGIWLRRFRHVKGRLDEGGFEDV